MTTPTSTRPRAGTGSGRQAGTGSGRQAGTGSGRQAGPRPAIDPRIRQRRIEVARSAGRRRLHILSWTTGTVAAIVTSLIVLHSPLVGVSHIRISGASHVSDATIRSVSGISAHEPMIDISAGAVDKRLERVAWIGTVHTVRQWPSTVRIDVVERVPVAKLPARAGQWSVVDATGRVLAITANPEPGVATVAGIDQMPGLGASLSSAAGPALAVASALKSDVPASVLAQITAIDQVAGGDVELHLAFGALADLGGVDQLKEKLQALSTVLARVSLAGVKAIDVSVPQAPTLTRGH
ncbi:MAG: cell division protein FtsQ/DivIB [Acidimicrobiales bacterium]